MRPDASNAKGQNSRLLARRAFGDHDNADAGNDDATQIRHGSGFLHAGGDLVEYFAESLRRRTILIEMDAETVLDLENEFDVASESRPIDSRWRRASILRGEFAIAN